MRTIVKDTWVVSAKDLLSEYPRLVDTLRNRSQADPFVIATAAYFGGVVVTGEVPSRNLKKPKFPMFAYKGILGVSTFWIC